MFIELLNIIFSFKTILSFTDNQSCFQQVSNFRKTLITSFQNLQINDRKT